MINIPKRDSSVQSMSCNNQFLVDPVWHQLFQILNLFFNFSYSDENINWLEFIDNNQQETMYVVNNSARTY